MTDATKGAHRRARWRGGVAACGAGAAGGDAGNRYKRPSCFSREDENMSSPMIRTAALVFMLFSSAAMAQTNPLWHEVKTKNYLPHMTWPEVRDLLTRSDVALIPIPSIEQHGPQTPMGTDYYAVSSD
jgi:hypothetical protein